MGQGKLCVWWEGTEGRGQVERLFSARLREEEKGKAEGRQRGGPKGKTEREGSGCKLTGGHDNEEREEAEALR